MFRHPLPLFDLSPLRWQVLALIGAALALASFDRAALESMVLLARDTLHLSDNGLVVAERAIGLGFGLMLPLGAVLVYLLGPRRVLVWGAVGCTLATVCMGFAANLGGATLFFLWLGVAAGALPSAAIVAAIRWFPVQQRGGVCGLFLGLSSIVPALFWGGVAGLGVRRLPLAAFIVLGLAGIAWAVAWYLYYPRRGDRPAAAGDAALDVEMRDQAIPLKPVLRRGWPLFLMAFIQAYGVGLCRNWLPASLLARWHQDILSSFNVTIADNFMLGAGCIAGGLLTDRCVQHSHNVTSARQLVITLGFMGAAICFIPILTAVPVASVVFWQVAAFGCLGLAMAPLWCLPLDIAPVAPALMVGCVAAGYSLALGLSPDLLAMVVGWLTPPILGMLLLTGGAIGVFFLQPGLPLLASMQAVIPMTRGAGRVLVPLETQTAKSFAAMRAEREWEAQPMDDDELLASLRNQGLLKNAK